MQEFSVLESATRCEAALAAVLSGQVSTAMLIISEMPVQDQYELRQAAETLATLCKKP